MTPLRVLLVSEPMEYGVLTHLERLCDGLDPARCTLGLAYSPRRMAPQAHALVTRLRARGLRVRPLPFHRGIGVGDARAAAGLMAEMRRFRPDVVHCHSTKAGLIGRTVAATLRVPALYTPHGTSWHYTGRRIGALQLALERALRRSTTALVSVCPEEARAFVAEVGYGPDHVRIVPNGVDVPDEAALAAARARTRRTLGLRPDEVWLVFVGRLTAEKGADVLVAAAEAGTGADGVLVVGEGPDRAGLEARARRGRLPVRFVGYQADVSPFLAAADIFVQPSRSEGLPFAALEAMAHGLPVVATGVGGLAGALAGVGELVPPADAEAIAGTLRKVVGDPARRRALGAAGRARVVRDFGVPAMVAAVHEAYESAHAAAARERSWLAAPARIGAGRG